MTPSSEPAQDPAAPPRRAANRARLWLTAAVIAAYLPIVGAPLKGWWDYSAFWAGAKVAFGPELLDLRSVLILQRDLGLPPSPFVYPPGIALAYLPFTLLPYQLGAALHVLLMLGALVAAAVIWGRLVGIPRRWAVLGALAWGPAAASVVSGQNATLVLLVAGLVARLLQGGWVAGSDEAGGRGHSASASRSFLAGLLGGLAGYKPQLGGPIALAAVVRARPALAAVLGVGLAGVIHYGAGVLATGGDWLWPRTWLTLIGSWVGAEFAENGWLAISPPAIGARIGFLTGSAIPVAVGWVVGIALAVPLVRPILRRGPAVAVALALVAGVLVNPRAWVYDATVLLPAIGLVGLAVARRGWTRRDVVPLVLTFAAGSTWAFGGFAGITALPLVVAWLPFVAGSAASLRPEVPANVSRGE